MAEPVSETQQTNVNANGANLSNGEVAISGLIVVNSTGLGAYLQVFNRAVADVTLGTTVPRFEFYLQPTENPSLVVPFVPPLRFDVRLSVFGTTLAGGSTGVGNGLHVQALIV